MNEESETNAIWITWENQLRNKTLSYHLGAKLHQLESSNTRLLRYASLTWSTFIIMVTTNSKNIVVQNPSIVLALVANIFSRICFKYLIVDALNGGFFPLEGESKLLNWIAILLIRITQLTIVTNQALVDYVQDKKGKAILVPDPVPTIPIFKTDKELTKMSILFICTWAKDEPFKSVIDAARILSDDYHVYITGNYLKKLTADELNLLPDNVTLTGFISEEEYYNLLNQVDVTLDLTTRENCLVCGAYESVAVEKPMILSDTAALRDYFYKGAVYTNNSAKDIACKIKQIMSEKIHYTKDVSSLKQELGLKWGRHLNDLKKELK